MGGGEICPKVSQTVIPLERNVGLTSKQSVNSFFELSKGLSKKIDKFRPWRGQGGTFFTKGPPKSASQDPFWYPFGGQWWWRRVLWALLEFHNDQKKCSKMFRGTRKCLMYKWYFSLDFSLKSWGPFEGPCRVHWRTMAALGSNEGTPLCP